MLYTYQNMLQCHQNMCHFLGWASVLRQPRVCIMQVIQNDKASQNHKYNTTIIQVSNQLELSQYNKGQAVTLNKIIVKIERKDEEKERTYKAIIVNNFSSTTKAFKTFTLVVLIWPIRLILPSPISIHVMIKEWHKFIKVEGWEVVSTSLQNPLLQDLTLQYQECYQGNTYPNINNTTIVTLGL